MFSHILFLQETLLQLYHIRRQSVFRHKFLSLQHIYFFFLLNQTPFLPVVLLVCLDLLCELIDDVVKIKFSRLYNFFPRTPHVDGLVVLVR